MTDSDMVPLIKGGQGRDIDGGGVIVLACALFGIGAAIGCLVLFTYIFA